MSVWLSAGFFSLFLISGSDSVGVGLVDGSLMMELVTKCDDLGLQVRSCFGGGLLVHYYSGLSWWPEGLQLNVVCFSSLIALLMQFFDRAAALDNLSF